MGTTVIHVDDENGILVSLARWASKKCPGYEWLTFNGQEVAPVLAAIQAAVGREGTIIYISDNKIHGPCRFGDEFFRRLWAGLSPEERAAITVFVAFCSSDGIASLTTGVQAVKGFSAQVICEEKPLGDVSAFFDRLLP